MWQRMVHGPGLYERRVASDGAHTFMYQELMGSAKEHPTVHHSAQQHS